MSKLDAFFLDVIERACLAESIARGFGYHVLKNGEKAYHTDILAAVIGAINSLNPDDRDGFRQKITGELSSHTITVLAELAAPSNHPQSCILA
jgi:hypothetical protein